MANGDTTRLTIELEVILRRLNQTLRGLDQVRKRLQAVANIKIGGQSVDRATIAAQRLVLQQQRLIVQSQELANRQERARQSSDRLVLSQRRLADSQQRVTAAAQRQADAHARFFKAAQRAAPNLDSHARFFRATQTALAKAPQLDAHIRFFRASEQWLAKAPQMDAHVRAFRAIETNAARSTREIDRARRETERLGRAGQSLERFQRGLNSLGAAALRVGGGLRSVGASAAILVTGPLVALGTIAARSAADIDAIRNRLIATEGSLTAANERMAQLRRLADESVGVTRRAAFETFSILSVVGDVTEETINRQIQAMGRLNAAFTIDDQQQFFRNLVQIFSQGFERADIKEALGRVPIFEQLLQQAFGTADRERLRELKASGKLTLDTFLSGLAEAVNTDPILSNVGESIRVRFQKTFERLTDALEPLGLAILGPLERIIIAIEPIILKIAEAFARLSPNVQTAIVAVGLLVAGMGPLLFIVGGIAAGIGALVTALVFVAKAIALVGLPGIVAALIGAAILLTELIAVVTALGLAWQRNFLGIRQSVTSAAELIVIHLERIVAIVQDTIRRVLPTIQSITTKVLGAATAAWQRYGSTVTSIVHNTFLFVSGVIRTFTRAFGDLIDLVLKLIDGDWRGAWQAFARIIVGAMDAVIPLLARLHEAVSKTFALILAIIIRQAVAFSQAAKSLAIRFINSLAAQLILGAPDVRKALLDMLILAALGVNVGGIAGLLVRRLIEELRKAAAEGKLPALDAGEVGVDVGSLARRRRLGITSVASEDKKGAKTLSDQLDKLQEARDRLAETREQAQLELLRSRIETEFTTTKAGLDRELTVLENNFEDRLTALRAYLKERKTLEEAQINAEIARELQLSSVLFQELSARRRAAEREFQTELQEIGRDPNLKGAAKQAAIETAQLRKANELAKALAEFTLKHEESKGRVVVLEKEIVAANADLLRFERLLTEELAKQQDQLRFDLLEEQGRTADAEAGRLKARFTDTLRDLRIDVSELGVDLQTALANVNLSVLQQRLNELPTPVRTLIELLDIGIKRAQIAEQAQFVDNLSAQLRLDEERIQNRVLDGLISQREAQAELVKLQQEYRAVLLDVLKGELAKAEAIGDQSLIVSLKQQVAETERLGIAIDEAGQRINQALFSDLQSGLSGIFSGARQGFEGLKEAAISFGEQLLDTLNDIAATSILQQIEGLFKPDATNTQGTIGGFFSKLFGLQPKTEAATASATLQTGASTAAATLTTGATTAGTSFGSIVNTAGASFASIVISAASALAAAVGISSATQAIGGAGGGLGSLLGGAAATGLFPAVPGGVYKVVEGGYPEAVLTTDPRHATRQLAILRTFLRETRGLGGRIKGFAAGAFISPHEAQSMMLGGLSGPSLSNPAIGQLAIAGTPSMMKLRQVLVSENQLPDWVNSSEGEQVLVDFLYRKGHIIRKLGGK